MQPTRQNTVSHRREGEREGEGEGRKWREGTGIKEGEGGRFVAREWKREVKKGKEGGKGRE